MLVVVCAGPAVLIILSLAVVVGLLILSVGIACLNRLYPSLSPSLSSRHTLLERNHYYYYYYLYPR